MKNLNILSNRYELPRPSGRGNEIEEELALAKKTNVPCIKGLIGLSDNQGHLISQFISIKSYKSI